MAPNLIIIAVLEFAGLLVIARLWGRKTGKLWSRVIWTFALLVPLCGLILYAMTRRESEPHPLEPPESTGMYNPGPLSSRSEYR